MRKGRCPLEVSAKQLKLGPGAQRHLVGKAWGGGKMCPTSGAKALGDKGRVESVLSQKSTLDLRF
jgi:hypothetical protein